MLTSAGGAGSRRGSMQPLKQRPVLTSAGSSMPERHGSRRRRDSPGRHGMKNRRTIGGSTAAQCLARGTGRDTSENGGRRERVQAAARRGGSGSGGVGPRRDGARGSGAAREPAAQDLAGTARGGDQETRLTSHQSRRREVSREMQPTGATREPAAQDLAREVRSLTSTERRR